MATRMQATTFDLDNDGMGIVIINYLADIELQKLQRQYRLMESDRKAYSEESRVLITKQGYVSDLHSASINKLRAENIYLQEEIKVLEMRREDKKKNGLSSKKADSMSEEIDVLMKKIKIAREDIQVKEMEVAKIEEEIGVYRGKMGGVNAAQNYVATDRQITALENRLEKALIKFNKALLVNKRLREQIDALRRERLVFDHHYHKYEKELQDQKKQMADIIEASNSAYEARDEAQTRIFALKERSEKEQQAYIQEVKELDRILEQDRRLKEFMATKNCDRSGKRQDVKKGHKDPVSGVYSRQNGGQEDQPQLPLEAYEKAFSEIRKVTGIEDVSEFVQKFNAVEDQNFSLFNYVNEINNEIELHAECISELEKRLEDKHLEAKKQEEERNAKVALLEERLKDAQEKTALFQKRNEEIVSTISDLSQNVDNVIQSLAEIAKKPASPSYQSFETDDEDKLEKLANSQRRNEKLRGLIDFHIPSGSISDVTITPTNLIQYLGLLEQKANELMTLSYVVANPRKVIVTGENDVFIPAGGMSGLTGQGPQEAVGQLEIQAPTTGDDNADASEDDERPLSREEIKSKAVKGMMFKREKSVRKQPVKIARKAK